MKVPISIAILLALGLQFNSISLCWLGYYTCEHEYFMLHCENPTSPCCQGKCQVRKALSAERNAASGQAPLTITILPIQPGVISNSVDATVPATKLPHIHFFATAEPLKEIAHGIFHPPRFFLV